MDEVFSSWPDLTDQLISHPNIEYFTDGSSFVQDGTHFAENAVVTLDAVIEAHPPLVGTSAQKSQAHCSHVGTPACCRSAGKHINRL
jgi:hypothetical protein